MKNYFFGFLILSLLAFAMSPVFMRSHRPEPVILKPNTPLSSYDPDDSLREGHMLPSWEFLPDTYTMDDECIVL